MTNLERLDPKAYLSQLIRMDTYIQAKREDYELAMARATSITQRHDEIRVTGGKSSREDLIIRCVEISDEIDRAIDDLIALQREARGLIDKLDDARYKTILTLRYIHCRSWGYIAEHMSYDVRWVHRLHGQALERFSHIKPLP